MKYDKYYEKYIVYGCCVAILVFMLALFGSVSADGDWWDTDWSYSREIIIESDYVDNDLTNFPVLIKINDTIGDLCKSSGEDIRFVIDGNVSGTYNYEIEKWVDNEDRIVWVNISRIESGVDTVLWLYYGNNSAVDDQDVEGTWDTDFKAVYHMNDNTTSQVKDSTQYDNDGTKSSANNPIVSTSGMIGDAQDFSTDVINIGYDSSLNADSFTMSCWFNMDTSGADKTIMSSKAGISDYFIWKIHASPVTPYFYGRDSGTLWQSYSTTPTVSTGSWYYTSSDVSNGNDNPDNYIDLVKTTLGTSTSADVGDRINHGVDILIGVYDNGEYWDGKIDELRISNIERNATWVNATYHSTNYTEGFLLIGSENGGICSVDLGSFYYNESNIDGDRTSWINHSWNTYYCIDNTTYWNGNHTYTAFAFDGAVENYVVMPWGVIGINSNSTWNWDSNQITSIGKNGYLTMSYYWYYNTTLCEDYYINHSYKIWGFGGTFGVSNDAINTDILCDDFNGTGIHWLNLTYNTSNKNKGVIVNTSFTKDNDSWYQNVTVGDDDWLFISAFAIEEEQLSLFVTMTLFCFFFYTGYTSNKRSGGVLMLFSGFTLIGFSFLVSGVLDTLLIIPLLSPIGILIIILGIRKWLYPVENEYTKSEGT